MQHRLLAVNTKKDYLFINPNLRNYTGYVAEKFHRRAIHKIFKGRIPALDVRKKVSLIVEGGGMRSVIFNLGIFYEFAKHNFLTQFSTLGLDNLIAGSAAALTMPAFLSGKLYQNDEEIKNLIKFLSDNICTSPVAYKNTIIDAVVAAPHTGRLIFPVRKIIDYLQEKNFINTYDLARINANFFVTSTIAEEGKTFYHDINNYLKHKEHKQASQAIFSSAAIPLGNSDFPLIKSQTHLDGEILNKIPFHFLFKEKKVCPEDTIIITNKRPFQNFDPYGWFVQKLFKSKFANKFPRLWRSMENANAVIKNQFRDVDALATGNYFDENNIKHRASVIYAPEDFELERDSHDEKKLWQAFEISRRVGREILEQLNWRQFQPFSS